MLRKLLLSIIKFYQLGISPYIGSRCRFTPTCSQYCSECLSKFPISRALWYSFLRLIKCHPFHSGGYDPIPDEYKHK